MKKADVLEQWESLPEGMNPLPFMAPIAYKASGSSYGACGVRIDGNPQFVDAVLSRLKPLLLGENAVTRLGLSRSPVDHTFKPGLEKAGENAEVCYIRLHMRGGEGSMAASFDRTLAHNTEEYAEALGVKAETE